MHKKATLLFLLAISAFCCASQQGLGKKQEHFLGIYTAQGKGRIENLDRCKYYETEDGDFWIGVYDGHSGIEAPEYLEKNLHMIFAQNKQVPIGQRLNSAFLDADVQVKTCCNNKSSGSTASVVYISKKDNIAYLAHVGDSSAGFMEYNGKNSFFTTEHVPNRKNEKMRIENYGGSVGNVKGNPRTYALLKGASRGLSISRSIGSHDVDPSKTVILAIPECTEIPLSNFNYTHLIVASNGFWDAFKEKKEVKNFLESIDIANKSMSQVAEILGNHAVDAGVTDDITIVALNLKELASEKNKISFRQKIYNNCYWIGGGCGFLAIAFAAFLYLRSVR